MDKKGILSEHIMIYLKYHVLSWNFIISASSVNNFILLQKISRNLSVAPPARRMAKIHLKVILLCPYFFKNKYSFKFLLSRLLLQDNTGGP